MKKKLLLLLVVIISIISLFSSSGCKDDEPCEGEIINKEFLEEYTTTMVTTTTVYNGSSFTIIPITYFLHYPDRWRLTVQWYADGAFYEREIYVTKDCYEAVNIGDWFVYDKEYCSYTEPCEKKKE